MSIGYALTPLARDDLQEISRYTKEIWGANQAKKYIEQLRKALMAIAQRPKIGRSREEIAPGLRSFKAGSYLLFYKESETGINVARILHSRRDIENQVTQEPDPEL